MTQFMFGVGYVFGTRVDLSGQQVAFFGTTQEFDLDIDQKLVTLLGQFKDPVDVAPGERAITGKIKFARLMSTMFGNLMFGIAPTASAGFSITGPENHSIPGTPFQVTVTNGSAFQADLGVFYHATGVPLVPVASAPATGQYIPGAVGVGLYTFATGDSAVSGGVDIFYQQSTTTQFEIDIGQQLMGTGPEAQINFTTNYAVQGVNKAFNVIAPAVRFSKMPMNFKNTAYMIPEMDFTCFSNAAGTVLKMAMTE